MFDATDCESMESDLKGLDRAKPKRVAAILNCTEDVDKISRCCNNCSKDPRAAEEVTAVGTE